ELAWRMHKGGHTTGPNLDTFVAWAERYLATSTQSEERGARDERRKGDREKGRGGEAADAWTALDQPSPRTDANSQAAHRQLLDKAKKGRIDIYFVGDSITRRWGATDYPEFLANWNRHFHGWNAAHRGSGGG